MDVLHSFLDAVHCRLSWISTDYTIPWKKYILAFTWGIGLLKTYALLRQCSTYSKTEPPPALAEHFTPELFAKSQAYGRDIARFMLVSGLYSQVLETVIIYYGGYARAWDIAGKVLSYFGYGPEYQILHSIVFSTVLCAAFALLGLPVDIYNTFVIEEKHGFNKTTQMDFVIENLVNWLGAFAVGLPLLLVFLRVARWAGDSFVPWLVRFLIVYQIFKAFIYPTWIQPRFIRLFPLLFSDLRPKIESLAVGLKFPLKHTYEIDGSDPHSNAYYFGLPWSKSVVVFDTLIKGCTPDEAEAMFAHELGHWYYMHPLKLFLVSQIRLFSLLVVLPQFLHSPPLLQSFDFPTRVATRPPLIISCLLLWFALGPIESLTSIGMNAISRKFEWEADAFACELQDKLPGMPGVAEMSGRLGRALVASHFENQGSVWNMVWVDWLYSLVYRSDPTWVERLMALEKFKMNNSAIPANVKKEL